MSQKFQIYTKKYESSYKKRNGCVTVLVIQRIHFPKSTLKPKSEEVKNRTLPKKIQRKEIEFT